MRLFLRWAGLLVVVASTCVASEKKVELNAAGKIEVSPVRGDGQSLKRNSVLLWQKVVPGGAGKDLWHDRKSDTWWKQVQGFATSGDSTFDELGPGTYRVTVRDGHGQTGAFGIGEPVVVDAKNLRVSTTVRLAPGGTL